MIFCVEDDSNIRELVVYTLNTTGMPARGFEDGNSFFKALVAMVEGKNVDGEVIYCNLGATFFNRTDATVNNLAISFSLYPFFVNPLT